MSYDPIAVRRQLATLRGTPEIRSDQEIAFELGEQQRQAGRDVSENIRELYDAERETRTQGFFESASTQFGSAFEGTKGTLKGGLALGIRPFAEMMGKDSLLDRAENALLESAKKNMERAGEESAFVSSVSDIQGFGDLPGYLGSLVGEAGQMVTEAIATASAGALVGSTIAPGAGTAGGFFTGLVGKEGVKKYVKNQVAELIRDEATRKAFLKSSEKALRGKGLNQSLKRIAKMAGKSGLDEDIILKQLGTVATRATMLRAGKAALFGQSYIQNSGEVYLDLVNREADDAQGVLTAMAAGGINAWLDTRLDNIVLNKLFGENADQAKKLAKGFVLKGSEELPNTVKSKLSNTLKEISKKGNVGRNIGLGALLEGSTESLQEAINMAAIKFADPTAKFSGAQITSTLVDSFIVGGFGGTVFGSGASAAEYRDFKNLEGDVEYLVSTISKMDQEFKDFSASQGAVRPSLQNGVLKFPEDATLEEGRKEYENQRYLATRTLDKKVEDMSEFVNPNFAEVLAEADDAFKAAMQSSDPSSKLQVSKGFAGGMNAKIDGSNTVSAALEKFNQQKSDAPYSQFQGVNIFGGRVPIDFTGATEGVVVQDLLDTRNTRATEVEIDPSELKLDKQTQVIEGSTQTQETLDEARQRIREAIDKGKPFSFTEILKDLIKVKGNVPIYENLVSEFSQDLSRKDGKPLNYQAVLQSTKVLNEEVEASANRIPKPVGATKKTPPTEEAPTKEAPTKEAPTLKYSENETVKDAKNLAGAVGSPLTFTATFDGEAYRRVTPKKGKAPKDLEDAPADLKDIMTPRKDREGKPVEEEIWIQTRGDVNFYYDPNGKRLWAKSKDGWEEINLDSEIDSLETMPESAKDFSNFFSNILKRLVGNRKNVVGGNRFSEAKSLSKAVSIINDPGFPKSVGQNRKVARKPYLVINADYNGEPTTFYISLNAERGTINLGFRAGKKQARYPNLNESVGTNDLAKAAKESPSTLDNSTELIFNGNDGPIKIENFEVLGLAIGPYDRKTNKPNDSVILTSQSSTSDFAEHRSVFKDPQIKTGGDITSGGDIIKQKTEDIQRTEPSLEKTPYQVSVAEDENTSRTQSEESQMDRDYGFGLDVGDSGESEGGFKRTLYDEISSLYDDWSVKIVTLSKAGDVSKYEEKGKYFSDPQRAVKENRQRKEEEVLKEIKRELEQQITELNRSIELLPKDSKPKKIDSSLLQESVDVTINDLVYPVEEDLKSSKFGEPEFTEFTQSINELRARLFKSTIEADLAEFKAAKQELDNVHERIKKNVNLMIPAGEDLLGGLLVEYEDRLDFDFFNMLDEEKANRGDATLVAMYEFLNQRIIKAESQLSEERKKEIDLYSSFESSKEARAQGIRGLTEEEVFSESDSETFNIIVRSSRASIGDPIPPKDSLHRKAVAVEVRKLAKRIGFAYPNLNIVVRDLGVELEGYHQGGKIYINSNLTYERAEKVLMHELAHKGFAKMLSLNPEAFIKFLRLKDSIEKTDTSELNVISKLYYGNRAYIDLPTWEKLVVVEEFLARKAEEKNFGVEERKLWERLAQGLREIFTIFQTQREWTDNDIARFVRQMTIDGLSTKRFVDKAKRPIRVSGKVTTEFPIEEIEEVAITPDEKIDLNSIRIVTDQGVGFPTRFSIPSGHISKAVFDKFDFSFMGTGEGAQAYGWGAYFWTNRKTRNYYIDKFADEDPIPKNPKTVREDVDKIFKNILAESDGRTMEDTRITSAFREILGPIIRSFVEIPDMDSLRGQTNFKQLRRDLRTGFEDLNLKLGSDGILADPQYDFQDAYLWDKLKRQIEELTAPQRVYEYSTTINIEDNELLKWDTRITGQPEIQEKLAKSTNPSVRDMAAGAKGSDPAPEYLVRNTLQDVVSVIYNNLVAMDTLDLKKQAEGEEAVQRMREVIDSIDITASIREVAKSRIGRFNADAELLEVASTEIMRSPRGVTEVLESIALIVRLGASTSSESIASEIGIRLDPKQRFLRGEAKYISKVMKKGGVTGEMLVQRLERLEGGSKKAVSMALLELGIKGTKFVDGPSRSRVGSLSPGVVQNPSYNYVAFDENDVTIGDPSEMVRDVEVESEEIPLTRAEEEEIRKLQREAGLDVPLDAELPKQKRYKVKARWWRSPRNEYVKDSYETLEEAEEVARKAYREGNEVVGKAIRRFSIPDPTSSTYNEKEAQQSDAQVLFQSYKEANDSIQNIVSQYASMIPGLSKIGQIFADGITNYRVGDSDDVDIPIDKNLDVSELIERGYAQKVYNKKINEYERFEKLLRALKTNIQESNNTVPDELDLALISIDNLRTDLEKELVRGEYFADKSNKYGKVFQIPKIDDTDEQFNSKDREVDLEKASNETVDGAIIKLKEFIEKRKSDKQTDSYAYTMAMSQYQYLIDVKLDTQEQRAGAEVGRISLMLLGEAEQLGLMDLSGAKSAAKLLRIFSRERKKVHYELRDLTNIAARGFRATMKVLGTDATETNHILNVAAYFFEQPVTIREMGQSDDFIASRRAKAALDALKENPKLYTKFQGKEEDAVIAIARMAEDQKNIATKIMQGNEEKGKFVYDSKLGKMRRYLDVGFYTFSGSISAQFEGIVSQKTASAEVKKIKELISPKKDPVTGKKSAPTKENIDEAIRVIEDSEQLRSLFNLSISPGSKIYKTSVLEKGKRLPKNILQQELPETDPVNPNLKEFFQSLSDDKKVPRKNLVRNLIQFFEQGKGISQAQLGVAPEATSDPTKEITRVKVGNFLANARALRGWPQAARDYNFMTDLKDVDISATNMAAFRAFGRNGQNLNQSLAEAADKALEIRNYLEGIFSELGVPKTFDFNQLKKNQRVVTWAKKRFGKTWQKELKRMSFIAGNVGLPDASAKRIDSYLNNFRIGNEDTGRFRGFLNAMIYGMLNNAGTSLTLMNEMFPFFNEGMNKYSWMKTGRTFKALFSEGFMNPMLITFRLKPFDIDADLKKMIVSTGIDLDIDSQRTILDIVGAQTSTTTTNKRGELFRKYTELASKPFGSYDGRAGIRPFGLFMQTTDAMRKAILIGSLKSTLDQIGDIHKHFDDTGQTTTLPEKFEKNSVFRSYLDEFAEVTGMPIESMARMAYAEKNAKRPMLTKEMYFALLDWTAHQQGETHLGNMPISLLSGGFGMMASLYKWSIRRAGQLSKKRFNRAGEQEALSMLSAKIILMISPMVLGAFGTNWLRELYFEEILKKRKNTRKLSEMFAGGADDAMLTFVEQMSSAGVLGVWGDLLDGTLNVATGEGNFRGLSLDNRIVLMSSLQNFMNATKFVIASRGDINYTHVARPLFSAVGGGSVLQTIQAMNGVSQVFSPEANTARRGNVANILSVYGRIEGLEGKGFYGTFKPTPINAELTALEFSVYENSFPKFQVMWQKALKEAIKTGRARTVKEAENYLKSSFRQRHPLRKMFRSLTKRDFQTLLNSMDGDSKRDVLAAVNRFNAFGQSIGISPYYGTDK
tara:strand:+ start:2828 stop:13240 length:10413 start_codon:yes stop_codon:yes gene_type:complete